MIQGLIEAGGNIIINTTYVDPTLTLEAVMKRLEEYTVRENLNVSDECLIKVRFCSSPEEKTVNISKFSGYTYDALKNN